MLSIAFWEMKAAPLLRRDDDKFAEIKRHCIFGTIGPNSKVYNPKYFTKEDLASPGTLSKIKPSDVIVTYQNSELAFVQPVTSDGK